MAAPTSKTDICNLALDYLSQGDLVTNIDIPETDTETVCARWYDVTRRDLLRRYVWSFAKDRASIPRTGTPAFEYSDEYTLPNNYLRLRFIGTDSLRKKDYEIEGGKILLNGDGSGSVNIGHIIDEEDVNLFDALFVTTFALQLALNIAYKFTLKNSVIARVESLLAKSEMEAKAINGQERPPRRIESSKFVNSRKRVSSNAVASPYTVFES